VIENDHASLRKNKRDEWELPGGKMEVGEQSSDTVVREMAEELGMEVRAGQPVGAHVYVVANSIDESRGVLVLSIRCDVLSATGRFETVGERFSDLRGNPVGAETLLAVLTRDQCR